MPKSRILLPRPRRRQVDFSLAIVNIVLLLVFFFLLTGSLVQTGEAKVNLARTSDLPLERLPRPLLLIDADGNLALDGERLPADRISVALNSLPAGRLHILADRDLSADRLLSFTRRPELAEMSLFLVTVHLRERSP